MSEAPETGPTAPKSAAARLFDLRSLIGFGLVTRVTSTVTTRSATNAVMAP